MIHRTWSCLTSLFVLPARAAVYWAGRDSRPSRLYASKHTHKRIWSCCFEMRSRSLCLEPGGVITWNRCLQILLPQASASISATLKIPRRSLHGAVAVAQCIAVEDDSMSMRLVAHHSTVRTQGHVANNSASQTMVQWLHHCDMPCFAQGTPTF